MVSGNCQLERIQTTQGTTVKDYLGEVGLCVSGGFYLD